MLYSEAVAEAAVADFVPVNALRNAALLPARTRLVALLDVDLLPSAELRAAATAGYRSATGTWHATSLRLPSLAWFFLAQHYRYTHSSPVDPLQSLSPHNQSRYLLLD